MHPKARDSAISIWNAGVEAVRAENLVKENVRLDEDWIFLCGAKYRLSEIRKLCVVGAGKASGYLAAQLEEALLPIAERVQLHGWVNVPANCVLPTEHIRIHAGRPAGVNEPRPEGVFGTQQILNMVASLKPDDLCLCLLTGGGSALLSAPTSGVSLEDQQAVTRILSGRGANICELNLVRIAMSDVKGGGLSRACNAGNLVTLIVSDIIGDPVELIASGPTVEAASVGRETAIEILRRFASEADLPSHVWEFFAHGSSRATGEVTCNLTHHLLANNATAVTAAAQRAVELDYSVITLPAEPAHCLAEDVGKQLIDKIGEMQAPACLIWGGEPVVQLVAPENRGRGGRNQQLVLTALSHWECVELQTRSRLCILSGGTDGEDGPTDAAGAFVDASIVAEVDRLGLDVANHLARNDAYSLFDSVNGLIRTGPTHTNVCDLRVAVIR